MTRHEARLTPHQVEALLLMERWHSIADGTPIEHVRRPILDRLVELGLARRGSHWCDITTAGRERLR